MRFEVNLVRVERAGLRVSSKVLSMARVVRVPNTSTWRPAHASPLLDLAPRPVGLLLSTRAE
jgi:hypothetical protein